MRFGWNILLVIEIKSDVERQYVIQYIVTTLVKTIHKSRNAVSFTGQREHPIIRTNRCGDGGSVAFSRSFIHQVAHSRGSAIPNLRSTSTTKNRLVQLPDREKVKTR